MTEQFDVRRFTLDDLGWGKRRGTQQLYVCAGNRGTKRIVPPAREIPPGDADG